MPHRLRYRLAFDHALCRAVLGVLVRTVLGWYRRRARHAGIAYGRGGTVTVVQRFWSGLELKVHFHVLGLDGVFAPGVDGTLRFHCPPPPTDADVARLVTAIARRIGRLIKRRGLAVDADATDPLTAESMALAGLASAAVEGRLALGPRAGARVQRLGVIRMHPGSSPRARCRRGATDATCTRASRWQARIGVGSSGSVGISCARPSPRTASRCNPTGRCWCCSRRRGAMGPPTFVSSP